MTDSGDQCISFASTSYSNLGDQSNCTYRDGGGSPWCYKEGGDYTTCEIDKTQDLPCIDCNNLPDDADFTGTDCLWECKDGFIPKDDGCEALVTTCPAGKLLNTGNNQCDECPDGTFSLGGTMESCTSYTETACDTGKIRSSPKTTTSSGDQCISFASTSYSNLGDQSHCTYRDGGGSPWCYKSGGYGSCELDKTQDLLCTDCNNLPKNADFTGTDCLWECKDGFVNNNNECVVAACKAGSGKVDNQCESCGDGTFSLGGETAACENKVTSCEAGFHLSLTGNTANNTCEECEDGTFSLGTTACENKVTSCEAGFSLSLSNAKTANNTCEPCDVALLPKNGLKYASWTKRWGRDTHRKPRKGHRWAGHEFYDPSRTECTFECNKYKMYTEKYGCISD